MKRLNAVRLAVAACALLYFSGTARAGDVVADYTTIPDGQAPSFMLAGPTVTASAAVTSGTVAGNRGLGVLGGTFPPNSNFSLDEGETLTIDYGQLVTDVTLRLVDIESAGNVTYAFEAFDGAMSLGVFPVPLHQTEIETKDLTALAGGASFTRITLEPTQSAPAGLQIQQTTYTPIPEPSSLMAVGWACLTCLAFRRNRCA